jgi:hypothetical protein
MRVLKEADFSPQEASRMMNEFAADAFLEEQDPELSSMIKRVSANLAITAFEIRAAFPPSESASEPHQTDQPSPSTRSRRRRHTERGES